MEESLIYLKEQFELGELDIRTCSPVVLAYIGDAAYELVIRTVLVCRGGRQANSTLEPSSGGTGRRLNTARPAEMMATYWTKIRL